MNISPHNMFVYFSNFLETELLVLIALSFDSYSFTIYPLTLSALLSLLSLLTRYVVALTIAAVTPYGSGRASV